VARRVYRGGSVFIRVLAGVCSFARTRAPGIFAQNGTPSHVTDGQARTAAPAPATRMSSDSAGRAAPAAIDAVVEPWSVDG